MMRGRKNGLKISNFKIGEIWFDPKIDEPYVIEELREDYIVIRWILSNEIMTASYYDCEDDYYVRKITKLEMELL